ncbi:hypothetical protein [Xenorhabdus hominickii]|uniref:Uncharacterized protein n=1 Tax=Xenorhabdus hominickii TaxID=351679 RepID=A0A2G0Q6I5_XENHO|nr:hypothetical protein [Xenorhabdus hominickii]PHM54840.1 hypothetical protein Xhom_02797 [Xenorhabdus hominickii]
MQEFQLVGYAEGLIGKSIVLAESIDDLFEKYTELSSIREKITIKDNKVMACKHCND